MKKISLLFFLAFASPTAAQLKIPFGKVQLMHSEPPYYPKWGNTLTISPPRIITITTKFIEFDTDRPHRLTIVSKNLMPSKHIIYECRDESGADVRVFLIHKSKMFVYFRTYHILLHFKTE